MGRFTDFLWNRRAHEALSTRGKLSTTWSRRSGLRLEPLEDRRLLAFTSTVAGATATIVGDGGGDTFIVDTSGGNLRHNRAADPGFNSSIDWDSVAGGDQTLPVAAGSRLDFDLGGGNDVLTLGTGAVPASSILARIDIGAAGAGDDSLIINDSARVLGNTYVVDDDGATNSITATGINIDPQSTAFENGITLSTGSGGNVVNILHTSSIALLTVNGGDGSDTFNITATGLESGSTDLNGRGGDDMFNINGVPTVGADLNIDGGLQTTADGDSIAINGVAIDTIRHFLDSASAGRIEFDLDDNDNGGAAEVAVDYVGLEPIADNGNAVNRVFDFGAGADNDVVLRDAAGAGLNVIEAPANAESVTFLNPTGSLTVNLGAGDDIIEVRSFDAGWLAAVITINGGSDEDEIRVAATPAVATTNVNTAVGNPDRTVIGRNINTGNGITFAQFNTGLGTLDGILGPISVDDSGGVGQLFVDDSGDAGADIVTFTSATMTGVAPAVITYDGTGDLKDVELALGTATDVLVVSSTAGSAGSVTTRIFANGGNDLVTIAGDALQDNNIFQGGDGNDTFTLNVDTDLGAGGGGISTLQIEGNAPAATSNDRDRLTINDNDGVGNVARNHIFNYLTAASGDVDITPGGVGGYAIPINVRTLETLTYNGGAGLNDSIKVLGTTGDDDLTVAPQSATSARVFIGGNPFDGAPDVFSTSLPGVGGGSNGPDLILNGLAGPATPGALTLDGGASGPSGNRLYVYGRSESNLVDTSGNIIIPGVGAGNAFDEIDVTDTLVKIDTIPGAGVSELLRVTIQAATFVQTPPPGPPARAGLIVNAGDEVNPALGPAPQTADSISAAISNVFSIQVNGGDPLPALAPNGDALTIVGAGAINVFSDAANPPNVTITSTGTGPFGITFSSIERLTVAPTNGIVNLIGDNNTPGVIQNDYFRVTGADVDGTSGGDFDGANEFLLEIGTKPAQGAPPVLSAPISFKNVTRINARGGSEGEETDTGVDTLEVTAFADNTPRGWGIETFWNEGDPVTDGDLLTYNGVAGISEKIVVQPSASQAGQLFVTNSATNTPVAVFNYVLNTDIIVNGNDGAAGDTDTLTLRGTNGTTSLTSGNDRVTADLDAAGTPGNELISVVDKVGLAVLYAIQNLTNIQTINFDLDDGNDDVNLTGPLAAGGAFTRGFEFINVLGGSGDDTLTVDVGGGRNLVAGARITYDGGLGRDSLTAIGTPTIAVTSSIYTVGPAAGSGRLVESGAILMTIDFVNLDPVVDLIPAVTATVNGTNADNAITFLEGSLATRGLISVDDHETYEFSNKANLLIEAAAGRDNVFLDNAQLPAGLTNITVNGSAGDDTITAVNVPVLPGAGVVRFNGGAGNDVLTAAGVPQATRVNLFSGDGNDTLIGSATLGTNDGGGGDDLLVFSFGGDTYDGGGGFDVLRVDGTPGNDQLLLEQSDAVTLKTQIGLNGSALVSETNTVRGVEQVRVEAGDGDDLVGVSVSDTLITAGPPDVDNGSLAFRVLGGAPNASDRLVVRDDGQGDLVVHRQGSDGRSGSVRVGPLKPVDYEGIEFVDVTPLNTITGRTGDDGAGSPNGQLTVFRNDHLESNASLLVATPLGGAPAFVPDLNIDPGSVVLPPPFGSLGGDEDWFEFRPPEIGTYRFETLFQQIGTLPSGRQGLPSDGNLQIEVYRSNGTLIDSLTDATDNKSLVISMAANTSYFLRVRGVETAINVYDLNVTEVDLLGPQVFDPDNGGPLKGVHITDDPATPANEAEFDLFAQKTAAGIATPTPAITSLTVNLRDLLTPTLLLRQPGDVYPALDPVVASQTGLYVLVGDRVGRIAVVSAIVTNNFVAAGILATGNVVLNFSEPLPDDRYTLTILDGLVDPPHNALDGENNTTLPSGNGISGGNFVTRFTVDTLPEIGFYAGKSVIVDINANGAYDPAIAEGNHNDLQFLFGEPSDQRFAGKFSRNHPGFDVLAAYGRLSGTFRFLIDANGNGAVDGGESITSPAQVSALAVAGNFDGNLANGDEIALFDGTLWRILSNDLASVVSTFDAGLRGYPLAGDFDGDGVEDLATYQSDQFFFNFGNDGFGAAVQQAIPFGAPGVTERPVAADMDGDGIDDVGLWIPSSGTEHGTAEWRFLISGDRFKGARVTGSATTLAHPFSPTPLGRDLAYHFGDPTSLPIVGNFDPPTTTSAGTTSVSASVASAAAAPLSESRAFVASLYQDILGRAPDGAGWTYHTSQLDAGATREQVTHRFLTSRERYGHVVDALYETYLDRKADAAGRTHWINQLIAGATEDSLVTSFLLSAEYSNSHAGNQSFLEGLYRDILGRKSDAAGLASHLASMSAGKTRSEIVATFLSSDERYRQVVDQLYGQVLHRQSDLNGLAWYANKLKTGQLNARSLAELLAASDEYFAKSH